MIFVNCVVLGFSHLCFASLLIRKVKVPKKLKRRGDGIVCNGANIHVLWLCVGMEIGFTYG